MIKSVLSSILESTGQVTEGTAPRPLHLDYITKATQTCGPNPDPSVGSDSEQETVTFPVAEMMWLKNLATDLLANDNEAKIRQSDMLTAIGDVEDENRELKDEVTRLEKKITDDTAHFEARIRALEDQHAIDKKKEGGQPIRSQRYMASPKGVTTKDFNSVHRAFSSSHRYAR